MATKKEYTYQIKGNKLSLLEKDFTSSDGLNYTYTEGAGLDIPSGSTILKSPLEAVTDGIELEYTYSSVYELPSATEPGDSLASIDGWTIVDGYLTICGTNKNFAGGPYSSDGLLAAGKYILIENMSPWNGIHKVQAVESPTTDGALFGGVKTFTKVNQFNPMWSGTAAIATDEQFRLDYGIFKVGDYVWSTGSNAAIKNNGLFLVSDVTAIGTTGLVDDITLSTRYGRGSTMGSNYDEAFYEEAADFTADTSGVHTVRKAYKARVKSRFIWGINFLEDESFEIDLPPYLSKALVYYVKAKVAEDQMNIEVKEYMMREFRKMVEKHENSKVAGPRMIMPGPNALR